MKSCLDDDLMNIAFSLFFEKDINNENNNMKIIIPTKIKDINKEREIKEVRKQFKEAEEAKIIE